MLSTCHCLWSSERSLKVLTMIGEDVARHRATSYDVARWRTTLFYWPAWQLIRLRQFLPYHVWYHWKALEQENTIINQVFLLFLIIKINETKTSKNLESVMKESQCLYQIIHRNAVVLLTLQILTAQLQIIAALIPTLQILAEVMMNPTKTGTISGRFSRCTTGSSSTRNAVVLLTLQILTAQLQILTAQLQIITALIPTLQILAEVMMNPTKTGSISRSTTGSSSTSSFEIRGETLAGIVQGLGGGISNILF